MVWMADFEVRLALESAIICVYRLDLGPAGISAGQRVTLGALGCRAWAALSIRASETTRGGPRSPLAPHAACTHALLRCSVRRARVKPTWGPSFFLFFAVSVTTRTHENSGAWALANIVAVLVLRALRVLLRRECKL